MKEIETAKLAVKRREAADMLSISERHLWTLTKEGKIRAIKAGRSVLYRVADLVAWLASEAGGGESGGGESGGK